MSQYVIDPFHRQLHGELTKDMEDRAMALALGSASDLQEYRFNVGYIQAIKNVLDRCEEIDRRMHGDLPGDK